MVTLKDVAAHAGVSIATVSHSLNKTRFVLPETQDRIAQSIQALGYRKDAMATWLKKASMPVVFLACPHADTSFFDDVATAIEAAFEKHQLNVVRLQVSTLDRMLSDDALTSFLDRGAGIVLLGHDEDWLSDESKLASIHPKVVLNWDRPAAFREQGVIEHIDHATDLALKYLAERGHTDIGLMTGPPLARASGLLEVTRSAARKYGLNLDPRWVVESSFALNDSRDQALKMLAREPRPSAMFTFGTQFGFGVLQAAYALGINVPGELSVLSYIECRQAEFSAPRMTTVSPSIPMLADHVVKRIIAGSAQDASGVTTTLDIEIIERESVARARGKTGKPHG